MSTRAILQASQAVVDAECEALRAENARLREALTQICALDWPGHVTPNVLRYGKTLLKGWPCTEA